MSSFADIIYSLTHSSAAAAAQHNFSFLVATFFYQETAS